MTLDELAAALAAAPKPSRQLEAELLLALRPPQSVTVHRPLRWGPSWERDPRRRTFIIVEAVDTGPEGEPLDIPYFMSDINVAMGLMPQKWSLLLAWNGEKAVATVHSRPLGDFNGVWPSHAAEAPSIAHAVCLAAVNAHRLIARGKSPALASSTAPPEKRRWFRW